jgi:hypothetical protein
MQVGSKVVHPLVVGSGVIAVVGVFIAFPWMLTNIFSATYLPHGFCFMWNPQLLWLHVISDIIISASYLVIAGTLVHLVRAARKDVPLQNIFFLFGAFILLCGLTHFLAVVVLWKPLY